MIFRCSFRPQAVWHAIFSEYFSYHSRFQVYLISELYTVSGPHVRTT